MPAAAPHRVGEPSPLILHLGAALSAYGSALLAGPRADSPDFPWVEALGVDRAALADIDRIELTSEIAARLGATVRGLEIWQRHPYRRTLADPPAIWEAGCSRLLDYGRTPEATRPDGRRAARPPGDEGDPRTRQSSRTLAAFRPWGG